MWLNERWWPALHFLVITIFLLIGETLAAKVNIIVITIIIFSVIIVITIIIFSIIIIITNVTVILITEDDSGRGEVSDEPSKKPTRPKF